MSSLDCAQIAQMLPQWGKALGFQQVGITDTDLTSYVNHYHAWLEKNYYGEMQYMTAHGNKRYQPDALVPGTIRVITVRMNYLPPDTRISDVLKDNRLGYISRYALGRDYHKLMRKRLALFAEKIRAELAEPFGYRVFTDSAPVLEKPLAEKSGLGWIGKHTNLLNRQAGSWFFLGEIYTDLPLPIDAPVKNHCGTCTACISICPTQAIVAPYQLDARRCISYLTIELRGTIPVDFRPMLGNRIYGCDDCQLVCPWNRFAKFTDEQAFHPRQQLATPQLIDLFNWSEQTFLKKTEGSAIRRIGHESWLRNIAVALGNATTSPEIVFHLKNKLSHASAIVREHVEWALKQHEEIL